MQPKHINAGKQRRLRNTDPAQCDEDKPYILREVIPLAVLKRPALIPEETPCHDDDEGNGIGRQIMTPPEIPPPREPGVDGEVQRGVHSAQQAISDKLGARFGVMMQPLKSFQHKTKKREE